MTPVPEPSRREVPCQYPVWGTSQDNTRPLVCVDRWHRRIGTDHALAGALILNVSGRAGAPAAYGGTTYLAMARGVRSDAGRRRSGARSLRRGTARASRLRQA
jgi:hypothetical protein